MRKIGLAIAVALTLASAAEARPPNFSAAAAYVDAGYRSLGMDGAALLVARDGKVLHEQYFGTYTPQTVVQIASSSKWLSGAVIMSLVDEGKIDLSAPVSRYLPQFTGKRGTMTIRQLFSHSSGLVDFPGEPQRWNYEISMAEYADRVARDGVMAAEPGAEVRYASASMQVAGAVAEKVTGKTWDQLFEERIARPLDMPNTRYVRTPGTKDPKIPDDTPTRNPMLATGAKTSLREYSHFLEMLANDGVFRGRRVLSTAAVREMQRDQTGAVPLVKASNDRLGHKSHYGIGQWLDVQAPDGRTIQVSSPGAWGFRPWINLDRDVYAIVMMQRKVGAPLSNETYDPWKLIDMVHGAVDAAK